VRLTFVVLVVSYYLRDIPCKKNYNYIFEFVKVMSKELSDTVYIEQCVSKNRTAAINMTELHQFTSSSSRVYLP